MSYMYISAHNRTTRDSESSAITVQNLLDTILDYHFGI